MSTNPTTYKDIHTHVYTYIYIYSSVRTFVYNIIFVIDIYTHTHIEEAWIVMENFGLGTQSFDFLMMMMMMIILMILFLVILWKLLSSCWISPSLAYLKLRKNGFGGPSPRFPLGNISEIMETNKTKINIASADVTHDIHSRVFPYFSSWQKSHGMLHMHYSH